MIHVGLGQIYKAEDIMRLAPLARLALLQFFLFPHGSLGQTGNECTTVVLHAVPGYVSSCQTGLDCAAVQPTTRVDGPAAMYTVYVYLKNYNRVNGVQVAFDWPLTWSYAFSVWNCQVGQLSGTTPLAPGPTTGTIQTAFNAISGGALTPIGQMMFSSLGGGGCLSLVESSYPYGNAVFDPNSGDPTPLMDMNEGRVCAGADGWNTCDCRPVAGCPDPPFSGTIFIDPDIITSSDPTTFVDAPYAGRGFRLMFDRRVNDWIFVNAYLFNATFDDGLAAEIEVNPEFGSAAAAALQAGRFGPVIGRLPTALRNDVETVWIHMGTELFGGGNNNLLIHIGQADLYESDGILEEALVHEGSHTSFDADHAASPGWLGAQTADCRFISSYARDFPTREDIAESFLPYMARRYRLDRISQALADTIGATIPNRIAYFAGLSLDMYPISPNIGVSESSSISETPRVGQSHPNPFRSTTAINYDVPKFTRVDVDIVNILGQTVLTVNEERSPGRHKIQWDGRDRSGMPLPNGVYFWRIDIDGIETTRRIVLLR